MRKGIGGGWRIGIAGGCGLWLASTLFGQAALPPGVVGERLQAMVAILTEPALDAAAIERIVGSNWSPSALAQRPAPERTKALLGVRGDVGATQLVRIGHRTENDWTLVFRSESKGLWLTVGLKLEPEPPRAIAGASIELDSNPPDDGGAAGPPLSVPEALAAIGKRIDARIAEDAFSGVVLIARDGEIAFERAAGKADVEHATPIGTGTRFNIGSISKAFTQVLIAELAAEGKISLEDKLIRHLPDYPDREIAEKVTLQQLLAHRSGLGDIFNDRFTPERAAGLRSLHDYLPLFVGKPLEFPPGTAQRYSNAGYVLLGLVVERVTGRSFAEVARERIFAPVGMKDSGWWARDALPRDTAVGYTRAGWQEERGPAGAAAASAQRVRPRPARHANTAELPATGSSAGGSYSTAADLLAFARALATGKVRAPERISQQGGIGIAGGTAGANAVLEADFEPRGWTVVVLENIDPPAAEGLAREIRELLDRATPAGAK